MRVVRAWFILALFWLTACNSAPVRETVVVTATAAPATITPAASVSRPSQVSILPPSPARPKPTVRPTTEPTTVPNSTPTPAQLKVSQDCSGQSANPPTKVEGPTVPGNWILVTRPDKSWFYKTTTNSSLFLALDPGLNVIEIWSSPQAPNEFATTPIFSNEGAVKLDSVSYAVGCPKP